MSASSSSNGANSFEATPPTIPDHDLLRCIGHGAYGAVWLARNRLLGAYRAVKVVYRRAFTDDRPYERELGGIHRFEPVSRTHEGFVDVLHIGENQAEGYFYCIMELADDRAAGPTIDPVSYSPRTVASELAGHRRLPLAECVQLGLSLSKALTHLHQHGLVHRDIKPANIIFVGGVPKLADIGLVSSIEDTASFVGTAGYLPPEGPGSPSADVFALGKVLYEMSTGLDRHTFPRLPAELESAPDADGFQELNEVILRACQNDPRTRYQNADDMHADLLFLLSGKSVKRLRLLERRLAQFKKVSIALAILAVVLGGAWFQINREVERRAELRQRRVGAQLAYGIQAMDEGRLLESLPFLVEALRLDDASGAEKHRLRLGLVAEQCPKLLQVWAESGPLYDAWFSPDGQRMVLGTDLDGARVFDLETGAAISPPLGRRSILNRALFSPDGNAMLIASQDQGASLWNWREGRRLWTNESGGMVHGASFSPRGNHVVLARGDKVALVLDAATGKVIRRFEQHTGALRAAAYSPDGRTIVTAGEDTVALIWDAATGKVTQPALRHQEWVLNAAFSPDGRRVITASTDHHARVWDANTGQEIKPALRHRDGVSSASFSPDGRIILTSCWDGSVCLWDAATGEPLRPNAILPHSARVTKAAFHPDGRRVISVCTDGTARMWDIAAAAPTAPARRAVFSPDATRFLVLSNRVVLLGDTRRNRIVGSLEAETEVREAELTRDGRFLLTLCAGAATNTGVLSVWQADSRKELFSLAPFPHTLERAALSDEGDWLVTLESNRARLHPVRGGTPRVSSLVHTGTVVQAAFGPQARELVTVSRKTVYLWEVATGALRWARKQPLRIHFARFSPDGRFVLTGTGDSGLAAEGAAQVWDTATGEPVGKPVRHRDGILHGVFSRDSERVATGSEDFKALLWRRDQREPEPRPLFHRHQVHGVGFSPGGGWLLTVSRDESARLWDAVSGEPLSPPVPHGSGVRRGVFLEDRLFLTTTRDGWSRLWRLEPDGRPVEDLALLSQLLSGKPLESTTAEARENWLATWRALRTKYPETFQTTRQELIAWHRQQAALAVKAGLREAARFHCDCLSTLPPEDEDQAALRLEAPCEPGESSPRVSE